MGKYEVRSFLAGTRPWLAAPGEFLPSDPCEIMILCQFPVQKINKVFEPQMEGETGLHKSLSDLPASDPSIKPNDFPEPR